MFRSLVRDVAQRPLARHRKPTLRPCGVYQLFLYRSAHLHTRNEPRPSFARLLSSSGPSSGTQTSSSEKSPAFPLPGTPNRKPKVDLRPGPIKPKASNPPATPVPNLHPHGSPRTSSSSHIPSLGKVKEEAIKDVADAEAHGILKPPPPGANWFRRTMHKGIELAKFYYRGVKLIFIRRKDISAIQARIKAGGSPLTRQESRLIRTQKDDVNKVIPFLIIAVLLEEVIPLIAIYAPFMLPSTCILPSQRARIEEKRTEKALAFATNNRRLFAMLKKKEDPQGHLPLDALRLDGASTAVCGLLTLSTIGNDALRIRRIRKHLEYITADDELLMQDRLSLSEKDLNDALEERGIMTADLALKAKESRLKGWLDSVKEPKSDNPITRRLLLLVSRPKG